MAEDHLCLDEVAATMARPIGSAPRSTAWCATRGLRASRDYLRRPAQLLGGLRDVGVAAGASSIPYGLSFVGASLSSAGTMEAYEHNFPKADPLRPLFLADHPGGGKPDWTYNMLLKHGVRSCLEYAKSFDLKRAHAVSNPELGPHLEFVDLGGHGFMHDGSAQRG